MTFTEAMTCGRTALSRVKVSTGQVPVDVIYFTTVSRQHLSAEASEGKDLSTIICLGRMPALRR